jgi:hypothetical protein
MAVCRWCPGPAGAGWLFFGLGVAATRRLAAADALGPVGLAMRLDAFIAFSRQRSAGEQPAQGNITHIVLFFLVMALLLWRAGRDYAAGLVLGVCAVLKLPLLLYGIYFLARRRWLVVAGGATTIGATLLASLAVFGPDINIGWYEYCVEPFVGRAVPAFNVQSVDGFLIRLTTGHALLPRVGPHRISAAHAVRAWRSWRSCMAAFYLLRRADRREAMPRVAGALSVRDLLEFVLVLTLALLTSPLAWTHYYLLLLLAWGLYLGGRLPLTDDATTRWLVRGSIVLTSLPVIIVPVEEPSWWSSLAARTIVSAWFFGGLLLLSAVVRGIWLATQPGGSERAKEMGVEP